MIRNDRSRRLLTAGLTAAAVLALAACGADTSSYPNSTFEHTTEFNTAIDNLWDTLLFWGTVVFVIVEVLLVYTIWRYRRRPGVVAKHIHGNTTLELMWTLIPVVILAIIAVPTVRTIFRTQAKAAPNALQVEVVGHQWWWEFRYPQYTARNATTGRIDTLVTANELYLPIGRTVNFQLRTADVLHSFWIPRLGGKRDLVNNHTNYLWFTPDDSLGTNVFRGSCNEYCGASHANMLFRAVTVPAEEFERWAAHQVAPAVFNAMAVPGAPGTTPAGVTPAAGTQGAPVVPAASPAASPTRGTPPPATGAQANQAGSAAAQPASGPGSAQAAQQAAQGAQSGAPTLAYAFSGQVPDYAIPNRPVPAGLDFPANLVGDPARGQQIYSRSSCIGCHMITGNPMSPGRIGPNLTHVGSRLTLGAGMFPNDTRHLALWIKNARAMKPGSLMPTLGKGQVDPITKQTVSMGGLDDQQIADIVAYLQALK